MPKISRLQNALEVFNEFMIQCVSVHMFLLTDYISDENIKYGVGFIMVSFIGALLV